MISAHIHGNRIHAHAGLSLVELLVAMTLSLLILAGVVTVFAGSKKTYETIDRLSRIQENGRYALDQITRDIRSAGYLGCAKGVKSSFNALATPTSLPWDFSTAVTGFDAQSGAWAPTIDASIVSPDPSGDVLVVRSPVPDTIASQLTAAMANGTNNVTVADPPPTPIAAGDILMVTNCEAQVFFQVTDYTAGVIQHATGSQTPGNSTNDLQYAFKLGFDTGSEVIPVHTTVYYLRASSSGNGTSLWRQVGGAAAEELAEGIDSMQVLYGEDTDGDLLVNQYSTADAVTNWANVVTVQVAILVRSLEEYGAEVDSKTWSVLGTNVGPFNDRRMRQIYSTSTTLRNRTL